MRIKLIRPSIEYADQVLQYRDTMLANGDSLDGCADLGNCRSLVTKTETQKTNGTITTSENDCLC